MYTLDLINQTLNLIGERPITTSTGSLGGITKNALTTAIYKVTQEVRPSAFEQFLTFTGTNVDYFVPVGSLPNTVVQLYKMQARVLPNDHVINLQEQPFELLAQLPCYCVVGNNVYISPWYSRPISVFATVLNVPTLTADDALSPIPEYLEGAVSHTAAAILSMSYLDDGNAAALHRNLAAELIGIARLQYGITRGKQMNMGGINIG